MENSIYDTIIKINNQKTKLIITEKEILLQKKALLKKEYKTTETIYLKDIVKEKNKLQITTNFEILTINTYKKNYIIKCNTSIEAEKIKKDITKLINQDNLQKVKKVIKGTAAVATTVGAIALKNKPVAAQALNIASDLFNKKDNSNK